jgi:hypothetical protein
MRKWRSFAAASSFCLIATGCHPLVVENYLVPQGKTGWFVVIFDQKGWPNLEKDGTSTIYRFDTNNVLITSAKLRSGEVQANFFHLDDSGNRKRFQEGRVWAERTFSRREYGKTDLIGLYFFLGTETEFRLTQQAEIDTVIESARTKLNH